jgi:hypothetical protein
MNQRIDDKQPIDARQYKLDADASDEAQRDGSFRDPIVYREE